MHGVEAKGVECPAIDGIIEEADEIAGEVDDKKCFDAALIAAAQAVEHYEITRYGTLIAWAKQLAGLIAPACCRRTLRKKRLPISKLTSLAERSVNVKAA